MIFEVVFVSPKCFFAPFACSYHNDRCCYTSCSFPERNGGSSSRSISIDFCRLASSARITGGRGIFSPPLRFQFPPLFVFLASRRVARNDLTSSSTSHVTLMRINLSTSTLITRNAWQSLAYSPLGAAVSPPSK